MNKDRVELALKALLEHYGYMPGDGREDIWLDWVDEAWSWIHAAKHYTPDELREQGERLTGGRDNLWRKINEGR